MVITEKNVTFQHNDNLNEDNLRRLLRILAGGSGDGFVHRGFGITADFANNNVTVGAGAALIVDESGDGAYSAEHPGITDASIASGAMNYLFLTIDPSANNDVTIDIETEDLPSRTPALKLGEVDAASQADPVELNRGRAGEFSTVNVTESLTAGSGSFDTNVTANSVTATQGDFTDSLTAESVNGLRFVETGEDIQSALDSSDAVVLYPNADYPDQGSRIDVPVDTILYGNGARIEVASDHDGIFLDNRAKVYGFPKIDVTTTSYTSAALLIDTRLAMAGSYGFTSTRETTRADIEVACPNTNAGSAGVHIYADTGVYDVTLNVRSRRFDDGWRFESVGNGYINGNQITTTTEGATNLLHHIGDSAVRTTIRGTLQTSTGNTDRMFWNETTARSFIFEGEVWDAMHCNQSALEGPQMQVFDWEQWRAETLMDNITTTANGSTVVTKSLTGDPYWYNVNQGERWQIAATWQSGIGTHFAFRNDPDGTGWGTFAAIATNGELYITGTLNENYTF